MRFILSLLGLIISCISYGQNNFSEIISKSEKAVCIITTYDKSGNSLKFGTGFFIDGNGTCVSNYHIFEDFAEALITTFNNKSYKISEIIKSSNVEDLILFKIKTDTISDFLKINNVIPKKGEKIIVIGNPQGLEWSASEGIISSVRQTEIGNILQITAPLSSGSSGSPVINTNGEVIGIATFLFNEGQSLNFALHIGILDSIKNVVSTLPLTNKTEEEFYSVIEQLEKERADELNLKNSKIYYSTDYAKELIDKYVNPFIEKHPNSYIGYTTKGRIVSLTPDFEDAFKEYSKAIEVEPNNPIVYMERAEFVLSSIFRIFLKNEKEVLTTAISDLKKYEKFNIGKIQDVSFKLGNAYEYLEEYNTAKDYYSKFISSAENLFDTINIAEGLYYRANMSWKLKNLSSAEQDFRKALSLRDDCRFRRSFVDFLVRSERHKEAAIISRDDCLTSKRDYYNKASILYNIGGDKNEALIWLNKSLEEDELFNIFLQNKNHMELCYRLRAIINDDLGHTSDVVKDLNNIFKINPKLEKDLDLNLWLINAKNRTNDYISSLNLVNSLIVTYPAEVKLLETKGDILMALYDNVGAIQAFTKAIELDPKNGRLFGRRGLSKYFSDDKAGARKDLSKAGELGYVEAYEHLKQYFK